MEMDIAQLTQIRERSRKIDKLWETNRIKFIINQLGLKRQFQAIKDRYHENTGEGWYATFKLFADIHPTFPMVFSTNRLKDDRWQVDPFMPLCDWFNNYNDTPITRAYEEVYEQLSSECNGRLIGMLFPHENVPQGLVIYSGELGFRPLRGACSFTFFGGTLVCPKSLHVMPLKDLIGAIHQHGRGWRPTERDGTIS